MNGRDELKPQGMLNLGEVETSAQVKPALAKVAPEPAAQVSQPAIKAQPKPRPPRPPQNWKLSVNPPKRAMDQITFRPWIRLLLQHDVWLTPFEKDVCLTVMRQRFPSPKQRHILWWALYRIYPIGCGTWGSPSSD